MCIGKVYWENGWPIFRPNHPTASVSGPVWKQSK